MGKVEAEKDTVTRHKLGHNRYTVSLLTDHLVFSPNLSLEKKGLSKKHGFPQLKEWCPGHLWAPSCYHGSVGQGWEVVEKYTSGQRGYYEKNDAVPVVMIDGVKEKK